MRTDPRVTRKTSLITGASSGIGRELAKRFARDGFGLVLVARDAARLEELSEELRRSCNVTVTVLLNDLSQPTAAVDIFGSSTILVNACWPTSVDKAGHHAY